MTPARAAAAALAAAVGSAGMLAAPLPVDAAGPPVERIELQLDNDRFASGREERWYTSGVLVRGYWTAGPGTSAASIADWWCRETGGCGAAARSRLVLSAGQQLYTPTAAARRDFPQPFDRPYAGWLFASAALRVDAAEASRSVGLRLGLVGPAALGEAMQNGVHRLLAQRPTLGWPWQLRPMVGVQADYIGLVSHPLGAELDVVRKLSLTAGNMALQAGAGAVLRWGALPGTPTFPGEAAVAGLAGSDAGGTYVFGGGELRLVGWDHLVDGPTFGYESQVRSRTAVPELLAGLSIDLSRDLRLDFVVTVRAPEFDAAQEPVKLRPQRFGTLLLRWTPRR